MARAIKAESLTKKKEFYFEDDSNHNRKVIVTHCGEIGYIYDYGRLEAWDGTILSEDKMHPMKACRLLKEYWNQTEDKRQAEIEAEIEAENRAWLEQPLIKIMADDYKAKHENFDIYDFKKWFRRNLYDYENMYPDLA